MSSRSTRRGRTGRGAGVRLALRGIAYRRVTAVIVLVLAVVAATAAVVAPLYSRAAQESIARGALVRSDVYGRGVHVDVVGASVDKAPTLPQTLAQLRKGLPDRTFGPSVVSFSIQQTQAQPVRGPQAGSVVEVPMVERQGMCAHLMLDAGRCPRGAGEAALTTRSLALLGLRVGQRVPLQPGAGRLVVVGSYQPFSVENAYWSGRPLWQYYPHQRPHGLSEDPPITDTALLGAGTARQLGGRAYSLDVDVDGSTISLDDGPRIAHQVEEVQRLLGLRSVTVTSQLPSIVQMAQDRSQVVRVAAPLAAAQLVLLAWVILAHVVGSATQERAPELGLAKLRGLTPRRTVRFGLAEVVVLLLVAAPIGTLLGWWLVQQAAQRLLEPGLQLQLTGWVVGSVLIGAVGGLVAAAVAAQAVARGSIADLLRRVPGSSSRRRAGAVEGVVLALVAAGVLQLVIAPDTAPGPVATAAPGMIALGAALASARLLRWVSTWRARRALDRGRAASLIGWAGVARRAGTARTTGVLTAAICLLLVGVQAWVVADAERGTRALAETGAVVVWDVRAPSVTRLLSAVRAADPSASYAMAVARLPGGDTAPSLLAVDAQRADAVLAFAGRGPDAVASALRPTLVAPLTVAFGELRVGADVSELRSTDPVQLTATLAITTARTSAERWQEVPLGSLHLGRGIYRGRVPQACKGPDGTPACRLVAVAFNHTGSNVASATGTLTLTSLALGLGSQRLDPRWSQRGAWRATLPDDTGASVSVTPGPGLRVKFVAPGSFPARVFHGDAPEPLPALVARATDQQRGIITGVGLDGGPSRAVARQEVDFVPGLGQRGAVVDLELALRGVASASANDLQVWLSQDDPARERRLRTALAAADVDVTGRHSAAAAHQVLDRDGAVLALLLFLACAVVALLVAGGAVLVAAFVGARQRAAELGALRAMGIRRRLLARALLVENLAGVGIAVLCGTLGAALAGWAVLPVLPLFDDASTVVAARPQLDLVLGAACAVAVALLLAVPAVAVAAVQLRSGTADRIREGNR